MIQSCFMQLTIPPKALIYLLYQRTNLDAGMPFTTFSDKVSLRLPFMYKPLTGLRASLHRAKIQESFTQSTEVDYEEIKAYLPKVAAPVIADIGCGIAG